MAILTEKLASLFDQTFHNICPNKQSPIFGKYYYPLANEVAKGYSNATICPSVTSLWTL